MVQWSPVADRRVVSVTLWGSWGSSFNWEWQADVLTHTSLTLEALFYPSLHPSSSLYQHFLLVRMNGGKRQKYTQCRSLNHPGRPHRWAKIAAVLNTLRFQNCFYSYSWQMLATKTKEKLHATFLQDLGEVTSSLKSTFPTWRHSLINAKLILPACSSYHHQCSSESHPQAFTPAAKTVKKNPSKPHQTAASNIFIFNHNVHVLPALLISTAAAQKWTLQCSPFHFFCGYIQRIKRRQFE